jgi:hypothetical protein
VIAEVESTFDWSYVVLAVLVPAAILVYVLGNSRMKRLSSARNLEPHGRRLPRGKLKPDPQFGAFVGRALERGLVTRIAEAGPQPIMLRGTITSADATLGGAPGRECVYRNRSDAPRDAAIASDMIVIADETGRATVENLALAEVSAPDEKTGSRNWRSLYIGDTVEVIGRFKPERFGDDPDPTRNVYGAIGGDGNLYVSVRTRPATEPQNAVSSPPSPVQASQESPE